MKYAEARDVLYRWVQAFWAGTSYAPLQWEGTPETVPTADAVWGRVSVRHSRGWHNSLTGAHGCIRYGRRGTLWVQVFAPIGAQHGAGYEAAQGVVNALQAAKHPNVWLHNIGLREVDSSGAFQQINVTAIFEYDEVM